MALISSHDVVIIGGGPAGMTAAIYAAKANLNVLMLESNITGGLVNSTYTVENFPSIPTIHGMELMQQMREHMDSCSVTVEEVCEIEELKLEGNTKIIVTDEGEYEAKAVILATGRKPIELETPTEAPQNVHYCAICDGRPYEGKKVLVVGGGNSAFDESLYLTTLGVSHITLVEIADRFFAAQSTQEELLSKENVIAHTKTKVADLEVENEVLKAVILENLDSSEQNRLEVDGIFVFLGQKPNNELFRDIINLSDAGYILANKDMSTNIEGVFAAGDIVDKQFRQITTAMADGTIAALAVEKYLRIR